MASEVGICNAALINLGEDTIISLDEDTKAARLCSQRYAPIRDAELRTARWNFAIERVQLAQLTTTPAWEYLYEYSLPSDYLKLVETDLDDVKEPYAIEGNKVRTNSSEVYIRYVRQVTDPNEFDSAFIEALAARISVMLAKPLTDSETVLAAMKELYKDAIQEARTADAQENGSTETFDSNEWLDVRY